MIGFTLTKFPPSHGGQRAAFALLYGGGSGERGAPRQLYQDLWTLKWALGTRAKSKVTGGKMDVGTKLTWTKVREYTEKEREGGKEQGEREVERRKGHE